MTWKLTDKAKDMEPLPGVPWHDLEDDAFREAEKSYAAAGWPDRALRGSGFFEHVEEKAPKATSEKASE